MRFFFGCMILYFTVVIVGILVITALRAEGTEPPTTQDEITVCTYLTAGDEVNIAPTVELVMDMNASLYTGAVEAAMESGVDRDHPILEDAEDLYVCIGQVQRTAQISLQLFSFCELGLENLEAMRPGFTTFGFLSFAQDVCKAEFNAFFQGQTPLEIINGADTKDEGI